MLGDSASSPQGNLKIIDAVFESELFFFNKDLKEEQIYGSLYGVNLQVFRRRRW